MPQVVSKTTTEAHTEARVIPLPTPHSGLTTSATSAAPPAPIWRVVLAEVLDRGVPLPFIAWFFPQWLVVVIVWHLLCDCSPQRRSFGKWVCRLRVIYPPTVAPCPFWRAALQRLGIALTQAAWCLWWGISWVLLYELAAFACVCLSPTGRRPEEYLAGTQIVTEKIYQRRRQS
jgi:hypothetical protein